MNDQYSKFDAAEYLDTQEAMQYYLNDASATGDFRYISHALGVIARAKGMTPLSEDSGYRRESLYKTLSKKGNPTLKSLISICSALGVTLNIGGKSEAIA